jgi:hypothetical protein
VYSVKTALQSLMNQLRIQNKIKQQMACLIWDRVVGSEIRSNTRPAYVKSGILFVMTKSSSWANQLTFFKDDLIKKINNSLGEKIIKDIRFQVGFVDQAKITESRNQMKNVETCSLDEKECKKIGKVVKNVKDRELQYKLKTILTKDVKYKKIKEEKGFRKCAICNAYIEEANDICYICRETGNSKRIDMVKAVLEEAPWLANDELEKTVPGLVEIECEIAKYKLIQEITDRLDEAIFEYMQNPGVENSKKMKILAHSLACLKFQLEPACLDRSVVERAIGEERQKVVFSVY